MIENSTSDLVVEFITPDAIVIRKGDLGGFVLEAVMGGERRTAGFSSAEAVLPALQALLGGQKLYSEAKQKIAEARKVQAAPKKRGGRPKGSKNKPKVNGEIQAQAA